jgi:C-mannosyltransferase DPY19L
MFTDGFVRVRLGQYSNYPMEKTIEWIQQNTGNESIFAGSMPTMANLKLSTGRPIVIHPHYEHAKIRRRVKLIYSMFSRQPLQYVHSILKQHQVDYYVYESHWCRTHGFPRGCSIAEMYDIDEKDPTILQRTVLACQMLEDNPQPYFRKLFTYDYLTIYAVL